jgi:hypothetical protein
MYARTRAHTHTPWRSMFLFQLVVKFRAGVLKLFQTSVHIQPMLSTRGAEVIKRVFR